MQLGNCAQHEAAKKFTSQVSGGLVEPRRRSHDFPLVTDRGKKNLGVRIIGADFNFGERYHFYSWIFDFQPDQIRQFALNEFGDPQRAWKITGHLTPDLQSPGNLYSFVDFELVPDF